VEHLKGVSLRQVLPYSLTLDKAGKAPARAKHPSLLQTLINYDRKKFYNIGPQYDRIRQALANFMKLFSA
jgi:hypothetical protein